MFKFLLRYLFFFSVCFSQSHTFYEDWRYIHFTSSNGLPTNEVLNLFETTDSTIWISTRQGIFYYDGFRWTLIDESFGLPQKPAAQISQGPSGKTMVIIEGKLYIGNRQGFQELQILNGNTEGQIINAYTNNTNEIIFVLKNNNTVSLYRHLNGVSKRIEGIVPIRIWKTESDNIWITTRSKLYVMNVHELKEIQIKNIDYGQISNLVENTSGKGSFSIRIPPDQMILYEWNSKEKTIRSNRQILRKTIRSISISKNDNLLVVDEAGNVEIQIDNKWQTINPLPNQFQKIIFVKYRHNGDLWISTERGLFLCKNTISPWKQIHNTSLPNRNIVMELFLNQQGELWVGTDNGIEIVKRDGTKKYFSHIKSKSLGLITGINQDVYGNMWISSGSSFKGAYRWDGYDWKYYSEQSGLGNGHYHKIKRDNSGNLWFLGLGLGIPDPGAFKLVDGAFESWNIEKGLNHNRVYSFAESKSGTQWFGTFLGISKYQNGKWHSWPNEQKYINPKVFIVAADNDENLWFSNYDASLGYIDQHDSIHFVWSDFLGASIRSQIWDIQCDENGVLWIAAAGGLYCYLNGKIINYSRETGLVQQNLRTVLPTTNTVYVGGHGDGISILDKKNVSTTLAIDFDEQIESPDSVLIRWKISSYWERINSEIVETRYKVNNREWSQWNYSREATLHNLPKGTNSFSVQARDPFGVSHPTEKKIFFTAQTKLVEQPLFIGPLIMFLMIVAGIIARYIVAQKRYKKDLERNRRQISTDLHDEIGSNLGTIALLSQRLSADEKLPKETKQHLSIISQTSLETAGYLRDIVWYTNPKHDSIDELILQLKSIAETMLHGIDIQFTVSGDINANTTRIDIRRHVYLIFKEILHNIIKHSKAKHVAIAINAKKNLFTLDVKDDGIGFDVTNVSRGHGLNNLELRTKEIGGVIKIISKKGKGTHISTTFKNNVNT